MESLQNDSSIKFLQSKSRGYDVAIAKLETIKDYLNTNKTSKDYDIMDRISSVQNLIRNDIFFINQLVNEVKGAGSVKEANGQIVQAS